MSVYIPCLNPDSPDSGSGYSVGVGVGGGFGESGSLGPTISFTPSGSPFSFGIGPLPPFLSLGINFQFWADLFGLGETRIHREKETIQDVNTSIFKYLAATYGVPITDGHALQFPSDGVQAQFARRPDIAALVPSFMVDAPTVADLVFATKNPSSGEEQRIVNQFLANAAYNNWPVDATVQIWDGMVSATNPQCSQDPVRWMNNPLILTSTAQMGAILQYIPLDVLVDMAASHNIGDPLAEKLIQMWAQHPELVASIPKITGQPWQDMYTSGSWCTGQYKYPLGGCVPLLSRDHIQPILNSLQIPLPKYPDFLWPGGQQQPTQPPVQQPTTPPAQAPGTTVTLPQGPGAQPQAPPPVTPQPPTTTIPQQPTQPTQPQGNVLEIPNQTDLDRACQIIKQLQAGQTLTLSDSQWLLTPVGARAYYLQQQNPLCYLVDTTNVTPQIPTQQPNCPVYPPQTPQGPTQGPTWPPQSPQPYVPPPTQPDLTPCPPTCQEQIDVLDQKLHECCNEIALNVFPRLDDLEHWVTDIETRVPGPAPQLPYDPHQIPPVGNIPGPDIDYPPPDNPTIPTGTVIIPPAVIDCVSTLCDGDGTPVPDDPASWLAWVLLRLCQCVKSGVNKAKKLVLDACQFGQLAWGIMAECWLNANTPVSVSDVTVPDFLVSFTTLTTQMEATLTSPAPLVFDYALFYSIPYTEQGIFTATSGAQWPFDPPYATPDYIFVDTSGDNTISLPVEEVA